MTLRDRPVGSIRLTLSDHAFYSVVWPKLQPVLSQLDESVGKDMVAVRTAESRFASAVAKAVHEHIEIGLQPGWIERLHRVAVPAEHHEQVGAGTG